MSLVFAGFPPYWLMLLNVEFLRLDYSSLFDTPTQQTTMSQPLQPQFGILEPFDGVFFTDYSELKLLYRGK